MSTEILCSSTDLEIHVQDGLSLYPDLPYHNRQHGVDVIKASDEWSPRCGFDAYQNKLLVVAAAWHDAGFGDEEEAWRPYGSKEAYAVALMKQEIGDQYDEEDVAFIERAIMGTMMGPDVQRDTPEAKFLHLMDLSYLLADRERFLGGAMAVWTEEFSGLNTKQFLELQHRFLPDYCEELVSFLKGCNISLEEIEELARRIDENLAAITKELNRKMKQDPVKVSAGVAAVKTAVTS